MEQLLRAHISKHLHIPSNQEQQQKKTLFIGTIKPQKGLNVYELDVMNLKINEVTPTKKDVGLNGATKSRLQVKEGHYYCTALNEKNAERKFVRMLNKATEAKGIDVKFKSV